MGACAISGASSQGLLGFGLRFKNHRASSIRKSPLVLAFKSDHEASTTSAKSSLPTTTDTFSLAVEKVSHKTKRNSKLKPTKAASSATLDMIELDLNKAAEALEDIYRRSPAHVTDLDSEVSTGRKRAPDVNGVEESGMTREVVRSGRRRRGKRLNLEKRIALRNINDHIAGKSSSKEKTLSYYSETATELMREYSASTNLGCIDWKKTKFPTVLPSSEHIWLFKLMQPMKGLTKVKESLEKELGREPTNTEVGLATNMCAKDVSRILVVGQAARNKLIKHNLRLNLFVINKYFHEYAAGSKFPDLCQAGAQGLIMAIDRFEPKKSFRLSTYGLFWIRHSIARSMTLSSIIHVSYGVETVRLEIKRAKLELLYELGREPSDEEVIAKVGISPKRYNDVMRATKPIRSLNSKHPVTQEELINGLSDPEERRPRALLRLALDDVLDSLKPKENLVIRQRYGLDGRGSRTLGEIAGNLNISREMVRKHEVKALMKLRHPTRVQYLREHYFA